jgi:D-3-phosphoglycerate dehydrogenase
VLRVFVTHNPEDLDAYFGRALPRLTAIAHVAVNPTGVDLSTPDLITHAAGYDVVIAHRATPGESALFERSPGLVAFLRTAVDVSTVDVEAASRHGVLVAHAAKSFVASTAELALALTLDLLRNVTESTLDYRSGAEPPQRPGRQLRGRVAGIIGYGAIGSYLADALRALGVEVLVCDPAVDATADGFEQVAFDELLRRSEIVYPLAPAQLSTTDLIDATAIAAMRPGVLLVNVSRGELLDERAVATGLDSGRLGGLALDVGRAADQRPSPGLAGRPGVVATPHLGGLTPENADAQSASAVEQVRAMLDGAMPPRAVNPEHAARLHRWWAER